MSAATRLAGMGLVLSVSGDRRGLVIEGLQQLTYEARARALRIAKENRLLILAKLGRCGGVFSNPVVLHYRANCEHYPMGCEVCPDANLSKLDFCGRHSAPKVEEVFGEDYCRF
ncbi:MAG: hypothetical protein FWG75_06480 [Cystobacterineae bacterium]|nr:hypothetical protein [Cystobacterineae bacterium]